MIHGIVKGSDAEADQPLFDRLAELGERVEVRQEVLASDEYLARLAEADLLLLPYDSRCLPPARFGGVRGCPSCRHTRRRPEGLRFCPAGLRRRLGRGDEGL